MGYSREKRSGNEVCSLHFDTMWHRGPNAKVSVRPLLFLAIFFPLSAFYSDAATCSLRPGDSWGLRGKLSAESTLKSGDQPEQTGVRSFFVNVSVTVKFVDATTLFLEQNVRRYPPEAEIWSQEKLGQTPPESKGALVQKFSIGGKHAGLPAADSEYMAPLIEDYYLPLLVPKSPKKGATYTFDIPIRNAADPQAPPWKATLKLTAIEVQSDVVNWAYEHSALEQSAKAGDMTVHFKMTASGLAILDKKTGRVIYRKGQQEAEFRSEKQSTTRREKVTFELRAI